MGGKRDETPPPSHVFARRLRETREDRGLSQRQLAEAMTAVGRPMDRIAVHRMEKIPPERVVSLDEMLGFAKVLEIAPALLISPPDREHVWITNGVGYKGGEVRNWLVWGTPGMPELARDRLALAWEMEDYVSYFQAYVDAKRGNDVAGQEAASDQLFNLVKAHVEKHGLAEREGES
jgi:transcriptional regulator with XRE-family HTH domain